jgi:hypothetical protein
MVWGFFAGQVIERQGLPRGRTPKIGCSADQVYSQSREARKHFHSDNAWARARARDLAIEYLEISALIPYAG